jgi:ATP synthase protein I
VTGTPRGERDQELSRTVGRKAARRIRARRQSDSVWFWLGMFGLLGWSVAIPTLLGVALGVWLDRVAPATFSWILSLLVVGLALGLYNAWYWVRRESADDEPEVQDRVSEPEGPDSTRKVNGW